MYTRLQYFTIEVTEDALVPNTYKTWKENVGDVVGGSLYTSKAWYKRAQNGDIDDIDDADDAGVSSRCTQLLI